MDIERFIPFLIVLIIWKIINAGRKKNISDDDTAKPENSTLVKLIKMLQGQTDPEDMAWNTTGKPIPQAEKEDIPWKHPPAHKKPPKRTAKEVVSKPLGLPEKQKGDKSNTCKPRHSLRKQKQLRQAIIWKELLDKPLALRKNP